MNIVTTHEETCEERRDRLLSYNIPFQVIKIITKKHNGKKLDGVGLGNQIYWIPAIRSMQKQGLPVYTDSYFIEEIGVCQHVADDGIERKGGYFDRVYVPAYPSWKDVLNVRLQHPLASIHGVKYRAKGRCIGLGYNRSVALDTEISELETVRKIVPNCEKFHLDGHDPEKGLVVLGTSNKLKCYYRYWDMLEEGVRKLGFKTLRIGEKGQMFDSYTKLFDAVRRAEFYIGVDSGMMHLADILGIPGFVFWGETAFGKNKPLNKLKVVRGLGTVPSCELLSKYFESREKAI